MRSLVHIISMRRAGHHAIINWLQKNLFNGFKNATIIHFNDVYAPSANPSRHLRLQDLNILSSGDIVIILSYEDIPLETLSKLPIFMERNKILPNAEILKFLCLRDPYNLFASRLQRLKNINSEGVHIPLEEIPWEEVKELWKSYTREYLGTTNYLGNGLVRINYNEWVTNRRYRDELLLEYFNLNNNQDEGLEEVSSYEKGVLLMVYHLMEERVKWMS